MTKRFFIFGAGYSGKAFAAERSSLGEVAAGTTRAPEKFDALRATGMTPYVFDGQTLSEDVKAELRRTTHLIVSIAPDEAGDPACTAIGKLVGAEMPALSWIGYLSTVGVYGDHGGEWIDETASCHPSNRRSQMRLEAEQAWLELGQRAGLPVAVLRLSGIYGPGRNAFVNLANGTAKRLIKPGQVFNRIHVADIAGALSHLAEHGLGGVFNVTDDLPAPPQDVVAFAADLMGVVPPPEMPFETAQLSPMARSFYGESKRVSNAALRATGYDFRYPDYHKAFTTMWAEGNWDGRGGADARSPIKRS